MWKICFNDLQNITWETACYSKWFILSVCTLPASDCVCFELHSGALIFPWRCYSMWFSFTYATFGIKTQCTFLHKAETPRCSCECACVHACVHVHLLQLLKWEVGEREGIYQNHLTAHNSLSWLPAGSLIRIILTWLLLCLICFSEWYQARNTFRYIVQHIHFCLLYEPLFQRLSVSCVEFFIIIYYCNL